MGPQTAKISDFAQITAALQETAPALQQLWPLRITALERHESREAAALAWDVIARIKVSTSRTQIVAGSKFLHHVLPDLVPPIDRQYTFNFFTGQKMVPSDRAAFLDWFPMWQTSGGVAASRSGAPSPAEALWLPERRRSSTTPSWASCSNSNPACCEAN